MTAAGANSAAGSQGTLGDYAAVLKARITALVVVATAIGFHMGHVGALSGAVVPLVWVCVGMALVVSGANSLNQLIERRHDARMARTANRPLATGRLSPRQVLLFGSACSAVGAALLAVFVNPACAAVATTSWALYVFAYTPLKRITPWCVPVGAVPGALPPVIGWTAATGDLQAVSFIPFAIMFVWQLPHFHAIAWLYRDDYADAGYPVLPVIEPTGRRTSVEMIVYSIVLLPVSLLPTWIELSGYVYYVGALILGFAFLAFSIEVARLRTRVSARQHLLASLAYLTLLFALMSLDKV